jgi:hypothetical protein
MKTTRQLIRTLTACGVMTALVFIAGCADNGPPPPPPGVAVVGVVPDYCFWDGFEDVGWDGFDYYYWAPSHVWCICDPIRVRRATVWVNAHPNWHPQAKTTVQNQSPPSQSRPPAASTLQPKSHSPPETPRSTAPASPSARHGQGHDGDHDHHGHGP